MKTRTVPTVFRARGAQAKGANFLLSTLDRQNIVSLRSAFEERYRVSVSSRLVLSLVLEAMLEEFRQGVLRTNAEFSDGLRRVLVGAAR